MTQTNLLKEFTITIPVDRTALLPGDHVRVRRGIYTHHGIFLGLAGLQDLPDHHAVGARARRFGQFAIAHLSGGKKGESVQLTSIEEFLGAERSLDVVLHANTGHLDRQETVHRALALVGWSGYDLASRNCEHFATWCASGHWSSSQVRSWGSLISLGLLLSGAHIVTLGLSLVVTLGAAQGIAPITECVLCPTPHGWTYSAKRDETSLARVAARAVALARSCE